MCSNFSQISWFQNMYFSIIVQWENCFASSKDSSGDTSSYYCRYLFRNFFVVHDIQPPSVLLAILDLLSLQKFTKVITQVFICCLDSQEMERTSYIKVGLVTCYNTTTTV